jgi:hypothetical protein
MKTVGQPRVPPTSVKPRLPRAYAEAVAWLTFHLPPAHARNVQVEEASRRLGGPREAPLQPTRRRIVILDVAMARLSGSAVLFYPVRMLVEESGVPLWNSEWDAYDEPGLRELESTVRSFGCLVRRVPRVPPRAAGGDDGNREGR